MLRSAFVALTAATLLAACAMPPPATQSSPTAASPSLPRFEGARAPAPGQTRVYVFRPKSEDQALQHEQPILRVGQAEITPVPEATYAELQLPPGRHTLSLVPPEGGADLWRTSMTLNLHPDSVTYVAFWMADGFERTSAGNHTADTVLLVLPVGDPEDIPAHPRIERADPAIAEPILRQCCVQVYPLATAQTASSAPARR